MWMFKESKEFLYTQIVKYTHYIHIHCAPQKEIYDTHTKQATSADTMRSKALTSLPARLALCIAKLKENKHTVKGAVVYYTPQCWKQQTEKAPCSQSLLLFHPLMIFHPLMTTSQQIFFYPFFLSPNSRQQFIELGDVHLIASSNSKPQFQEGVTL